MILLGLTLFYLMDKKKSYENHEHKLTSNSDDILDQAHQKEKMMIAEAIDKSTEILKQTDFFTDRMKDKVNHDLNGAVEQFSTELSQKLDQLSKQYDETFNILKTDYANAVEETMNKVRTLGDQELGHIQEALQSKSLSLQEYLEKKVDQEFNNAQQEIANYKKYRIQEMEESLDDIILHLAQEILPDAISINDHETLVIKALSQAKEDGLLKYD